MRSDELLILNYGGFTDKVGGFYRDLNDSEALRELFLKDPAGILSRRLFADSSLQLLTAARINQANRLLFSLLSNAKFLAWAREYEKALRERYQSPKRPKKAAGDEDEATKTLVAKLDRAELYRDLVKATMEFADLEWFYSRMVLDPDRSAPVSPLPVPALLSMDPVVCVEVAVYAVAVAAVFIAIVPVRRRGPGRRHRPGRRGASVGGRSGSRRRRVSPTGRQLGRGVPRLPRRGPAKTRPPDTRTRCP